ncbi:MAG TPA: LapA family protein [Burkholderiaceae bacterium]
MRILTWLIRAFLFFVLFAFALNNQQAVAVHWFFGHEWTAPLVIVVLAAFGSGCAIGVLAMVPAWWRHRRLARQGQAGASELAEPSIQPGPVIRDGL